MTKVAIVIPARDGGHSLLDCISSALQSDGVRASVVVIDNASADGSIELVMEAFPQVEFLRNDLNQGFAAGCNQGIALSLERGDEFVLLLNQDAFLEPNALASMVRLAHDCPRAAAIGCRTLSTGPSGAQRGTLLYNGAWKGWPPLWQRIPGVGRPDASPDRNPRQVDFVWGHVMLLRCESLREVGLFDPGFAFYVEDLDLCDRLQQAGWQNWCDSRVVCWHAIADGARATHSEGWRWHMKLQGIRRYYRKRLPAWPADISWLLTVLRGSLSLVRHRHWQAACHLFSAALGVVRGNDSMGLPGAEVPTARTDSRRHRDGQRPAATPGVSDRERFNAETADM